MTRFLPLLVLVGWSQTTDAASGGGRIDVRSRGASGDSVTLDTAAINQAIADCAEAGGGQVFFPPGRYVSGTIQLRSHVSLVLSAGATLVGTTNLTEYRHFSPPEGTPEARFRPQWHRALLLGENLRNVTLMGEGVIDGNRVFDPNGEERMRGPHTILMGHCEQIRIEGLRIVDSANYAIMLEDCSNVDIRRIKVKGGWDGVHFRGWVDRPCRDVSIVDCEFYTGDDAIAGRYWERTLIRGCIINSSCNGIRLIGPATDLIIDDCLFYGPGLEPHRTSDRFNMLAGINLQPGGWDPTRGALDKVLISDVTMRDVASPFHFILKKGNTAGSINVSRVTATGVYRAACAVESWAETAFTNVTFRDVTVEFSGGGTPADTSREVNSPGVDPRPLPAWAFHGRNIGKLTLDDVRFRWKETDARPAVILDGIREVHWLDVSLPAGVDEAESVVRRGVDQWTERAGVR